MSMETWLLALTLTVPIAALALLVGRRVEQASGYWSTALALTALPLCLVPILPWMSIGVPAGFEPLMPALDMGQDLTEAAVRTATGRVAAIDWTGLGVAFWMLGALARGGYELLRSYRLSQMTAQAEAADAELEARVYALGCAMGVKPAGVYVHSGPTLVTGLVHARLYLSVDAVGSAALDQIIRHEMAHMARGDVWALCLARLLGVALWFNPFLFAVEARRRLAVELDCDRLALAGLQTSRARLYARALLDAAGSNSGSSPVVGFGVAPRKAIEMRLTSILSSTPKPKARHKAVRIVALGAAAALLGGVQLAYAKGGLTPPTFTEVVVEGRNTSSFGPRVIDGIDVPPFHGGHDIAAPLGTPVRAPAAGVITYAGNEFRGNGNWGYVVEIDHGAGWTTIYAHLSGSMFGRGDRVEAGQIFATVGNTGLSTGPHLHVEVRENGERRDPALYLPGLARPAN